AVFATGCGSDPGSEKVSAVLDEAEPELEKSETAFEDIKKKPPLEAVDRLREVTASVKKVLEGLAALENEHFSQEQKVRFERLLPKCRERQQQINDARAAVDRKIAEIKKQVEDATKQPGPRK